MNITVKEEIERTIDVPEYFQTPYGGLYRIKTDIYIKVHSDSVFTLPVHFLRDCDINNLTPITKEQFNEHFDKAIKQLQILNDYGK
jgi:hypothetical protein